MTVLEWLRHKLADAKRAKAAYDQKGDALNSVITEVAMYVYADMIARVERGEIA